MHMPAKKSIHTHGVGLLQGCGLVSDWAKGGGRFVAATEMLRLSVEHVQQAEVMP